MNNIVARILGVLASLYIPKIFARIQEYRKKKKIKSILERRYPKKPNLPK
jgi:hypothetical protein